MIVCFILQLGDILVLVILVPSPEDFRLRRNEYLLQIGELLNCIPILINFELIPNAKRSDEGVKLKTELKLDVSNCNRTVESCISSVQEASKIVNIVVSAEDFKPAGYQIASSTVMQDPTSSPPPPTPLGGYIGIAIGVVVILALVIVVLTVIKRKRTVRAAIWKPDQANTGTPRSASFEDDVPTSKRVVMGKEESRRSLRQVEDVPLKAVDEPQWKNVYVENTLDPMKNEKVVIGQELHEAGWSCLHYRALSNQARVQDCVQRFNRDTDYTTDVNIRGPGGYTALMVAVMSGQVRKDDEDESDAETSKPLTNGDAAAKGEALTVIDLLKMGSDPCIKNEFGQTALHIAAACSRADAARQLLRYKADPNAQDNTGRSSLHVAIASDAEGVFQILLRHKNINPELESEDGSTPLILATQHHAVSMVEQLLKDVNVDPNTTDKNGNLPITLCYPSFEET